MPRPYLTFYDNINHVEVDDDTFSLYKNKKRIMTLPKSALSVLITNYDNILLDFEEDSGMGRKYWSDEETIIYTKDICEDDGTSSDSSDSCDDENLKVFRILQVPIEINLSKEGFQRMLISAAIAYRIESHDSHRTQRGLEYKLSSTKSVIFHDSKKFSIYDEISKVKLEMPINALAQLVIDKKYVLRDLCDDDYFGETVYWSNKSTEIKSEYVKNYRVLRFSIEDDDGYDDYIRISDRTFEELIHIATGGPSWKRDMKDRMREIREIYWNSIPINTVKSIDFSRDGQSFTLINEMTGGTLTLPLKAFKAAQKYKKDILDDLHDKRFRPTYDRDYISEYWSDGDYALRTGVFYNLYRSIDCNVVRFTRLKDNYYEFVLQERSFLWLLDR